MYPVMLDLKGRRCLVVGGGGVALGKVKGLLAEGAKVRVIASEPLQSLVELDDAGALNLEQRPYETADLSGCDLVFATTDDTKTNRRVSEEARSMGIWVNVADNPELCAFFLPARVRRGAFQLAVASAGGAPFVVRRLRRLFEQRLGPEWAEWMDAAARFRKYVREMNLSRKEAESRYDRFFESTVDGEHLTARVPTANEESEWLLERNLETNESMPVLNIAHDRPETNVGSAATAGFVSLVGAGPGDSGLLTLRGRQRLIEADVVVYDRLAASAIPTDLPERIELRCVGKQAGNHPVPQEEINHLLVYLARQGKRVVRLKGGDPYVFGRGGEEAEVLLDAGVPFEVVPGITSAIGVSAYAGIPVTHRNESVRVTMITAHESKKDRGSQVRWDLLAKDTHATLVGYMGVTSLGTAASRLIENGMDPQTPAALIERGTLARQRTVRSTLAELVQAAQYADIKPPAIFVIGAVVDKMETLDWFSRRPLFGERIGVFAPAKDIIRILQNAGVETIEVPMPLTRAARIVLGAEPLSGFVFRNRDEVDALEEEREEQGFGPEITAWCLGKDAAERAGQRGWRNVAEVEAYTSPTQLVEKMQAIRIYNSWIKLSRKRLKKREIVPIDQWGL